MFHLSGISHTDINIQGPTHIHTLSTNQSTKWWYYLQDCQPVVLATPAMLSAYEFEKPYKGLDQGHTGHCLDAHQSCLPAIPVLTCKDVPHYAPCAGSVPFAFLLAVVLLAVNKTNHNNNKWDFYKMTAFHSWHSTTEHNTVWSL